MRRTTSRRRLATALTTVVAVVGTACSSGSGQGRGRRHVPSGTPTRSSTRPRPGRSCSTTAPPRPGPRSSGPPSTPATWPTRRCWPPSRTTPPTSSYRAVLDQQLPYLATSLVIGLATVVLTMALAAPAGYALAKLRPRGGKVLSFLFLVAQMIPGIIMAMGFYAIYLQLGLLQSVPGLIVADSTLAVPFAVLIFTAFMAGIPGELLQAAAMDGAGHWRTFRSVVLPMSRNSIVTVCLFAFLWSWSDFVFAGTLARGGAHEPITLGIYHYIGNNNQEWNAIMATAVVASLPATVILVLAQRYVAAGVTAGAVKD